MSRRKDNGRRRTPRSGRLLAGAAALTLVSGPLGPEVTLKAARAQAQAEQPRAQTALAQLVRTAEQQTGGRASKVELERERGAEVYEIKTVSQDQSATVVIDPLSGNVLATETPWFPSITNLFEREDRREDQAEFAQLEATSMTLAGAIDLAEKETGGRAVDASVRRQYGATLFQIGVVVNLVKQNVLVDPATNRVVTLPAKGKRRD